MLVYYSIAVTPQRPRPDLFRQLELSVQSLRRFNGTVRILVFVFGPISEDQVRRLAALGVSVFPRPPYGEFLERWLPREAVSCMEHYPLFHKFLNFSEIAAFEPEQVLYLDCDTLFFDDVARLFSRYQHADCFGREEPLGRKSHYGYDPSYLDEDRLSELMIQEGNSPVPPFNLGVVLFNNGVWRKLTGLPSLLLGYAWRFGLWMALNPRSEASPYDEAPGMEELRSQINSGFLKDDLDEALEYPATNRWIWDEHSLWFALGSVPGLRFDWFSADDVLQNGEFSEPRFDAASSVLCHYFSVNLDRLTSWLRSAGLDFGS